MASKKEFYVVGIGASAGGLEAIELFFSKLPADSGLAFVIIQHLSPDYKSLMPEILIKRTSLPVQTAQDGMLVKPNNVYLIPRKMNMKIFQSRLLLTEKNNLHLLNLPIDIFFHSLADDFEDKAIGVILSGTGSDGSRGSRIIKEKGGIIIAQNPDSAKFDGMPKSAITTGTVDFIIPPQEIPEKMIAYVKHPYIQEKDKINEYNKVSGNYLAKILLLIKDNFGLDFSLYKDTTINRRIERRLSINQIEDLKDYVEYLYSSRNEQKTLYKELLIGVTKFFRDSEAFTITEEDVIPSIFESKEKDAEIRIWVSACSTGEEAYSVAILFKEYMLRNGLTNPIKIFATDVDKTAIEYASNGIYNASISADVSIGLLSKYFTEIGEGYQINEEIREMIVFATHNVIKDPPFNKIDFLSCRNLLIYFQTPLQQKVLSLFTFALNKGGYLFLGSSETIGEMEHHFEAVSIKWKFFRTKQASHLHLNSISNKFPTGLVNKQFQIRKPVYTLKSPISDLINIFTEKILEDSAPDTIIVNENYEVINSFGDPNKYLTFPKNRKLSDGFEYVITRMVPETLKLSFSISINKALKSEKEVFIPNVKFGKESEELILIDLKFVPLIKPDLSSKFVIIYFYPKEIVNAEIVEVKSFENVDQQAQQRIYDLETELKHTKENLQASIEELETTNEELQSTNEELISANEELQSTNEELQSVNEELYTVNTEFQAKNHDLVVMNNDMENLLQNSEVRIVFLDLEMKIRKFTDNINTIFNLKKADIGRPILDITHHLSDVVLVEKVIQVIDHSTLILETVKVKDKWFEMRILPYLTQKNYVDGVVITFIDITDYFSVQKELKISEKELKLSENKFQSLFEFIPIGISIADKEGKLISSNKMAKKILKLDKIAHDSRKIDSNEWEIVRKDGTPMPTEEYASVRAIKENRLIENVEMGIKTQNNEINWIIVNATPTNIEGFDVVISYLSVNNLIENETKLVETTSLYQALFQNLERGFAIHRIITDKENNPIDYEFIDINSCFEKITGLKKEDILNKNVKQIIPTIENYWIETYGKVALTGKSITYENTSSALNKKFKVTAFSPKLGQFATIFEEIE